MEWLASLTISILATSVALQLGAAALALRAMRYSGRHRLAWVALFLALALMVERRVSPLQNAVTGIPQDTFYSIVGLIISALMAFSMLGLGSLLQTLRDNEERLTRLATTDTLTGLANRRQVFSGLEAELRRARRTGRPLALMMLDLDHFKEINDRHGHAVGDAVLVAMARRCESRLRDMDQFGRIGGEEFLVVLPETGPEEARTIAERLRATLADTPVETESGPVVVTMSLGLTYLDMKGDCGRAAGNDVSLCADSLLKEADAALYRAKTAGRNRVCQ
jgi:diguanylate cyclase (GGDEF)-like protein